VPNKQGHCNVPGLHGPKLIVVGRFSCKVQESAITAVTLPFVVVASTTPELTCWAVTAAND